MITRCLHLAYNIRYSTNSHVPSPYWAAVSPVLIPLSTCNKAADALIEWFDPDELDKVVGGERWWQVRGLDGVDGEWITETEYLSKSHAPSPSGKKLSEEEQNILQMEHLDTVMVSQPYSNHVFISLIRKQSSTSTEVATFGVLSVRLLP